MKIFISHNSKDKDIVEPIALKLAEIFGFENVFYDSWSIQPGDGIIDKMNGGLLEMNYFLFFVSRNSLNSNMVKLEWQNALYEASKDKCKFIPIKLDDCNMPAILLQNLYIDFYNYSPDVGLAQIIDVLKGQNTFMASNGGFSNIVSKVKLINETSADIEISAQRFQEPISSYVILFANDSSNVNLILKSDSLHHRSEGNDGFTINGKKYNFIHIRINRATTPGFPLRIKVSTKDKTPLNLYGVLREVKENSFSLTKTIYIDDFIKKYY